MGAFKDGKMHGQGTYTSFNGTKYDGEWKDGRSHGQGRLVWPNGDQFIGTYNRGKYWHGTEYNSLGQVIGTHVDGMAGLTCDGKPSDVDSWGTGFAVNQHHVVTNAHVVSCCKKVIIYEVSQAACSDGDGLAATVVATKQKSDLGLPRFDRPLMYYAILRSGKELHFRETVSAYDRLQYKGRGCPQYVMGQGKVTKLNWMPNDFRLMVHDSPTHSGSSGGPALDNSGNVFGVIKAGSINAESGLAVKPHLLEAFLKSNNVEYNTALSSEKLTLSEIKKKSDKFTVIIDCAQ